MKKIFALYKGDQFITVGTKDEISKELKISKKALDYYASSVYKKRIVEDKHNRDNRKILIKVCEE